MSALKSGLIYVIANVASASVPLLLLPLLTRVITPVEYGQVIAFSLLVTLCQCAAGLNMHAALGVIWFRRTPEEVAAYAGSALVVAFASTLLIAALAAGTFLVLPGLVAGIDPTWAAIAAVTAGANIVLQSRLVLWQSQGRAMSSAALQFSNSVLNVAMSLVAVLVLHWGGVGRNSGIAGATILMAALSLFLFLSARELRWAPRREHFTHLLAFGMPLVFHSFAGVLLTTADRWIISIKLDAAALGVYGASAQLGMTMAILGDSFVKAYSPWMYAKLSDPRPEAKLGAVGAIYAAIPIFFILAACLGGVLTIASGLLLGPQYRLAADYLPWFMLGGAFNGVYLCTAVLYFHYGRTARLAMISFLSGLGGAGITWILISTFGIAGAAMAYACSQALLALATTFVAMKIFDLPWWEPLRALSVWRASLPNFPWRKPAPTTKAR